MALKLQNLASARLAQDITPDTLVVQLETGSGAKFPSLDAGDWFPLALVNDFAQVEFTRCTAKTGDTLTIVRAQEGSVARAYSAGDVAELRITVAAMEELRNLGPSP